MDIKEAKYILNDAGFILESSQYDYEYELLKQYFPDATLEDIREIAEMG